MWLFIDQISTIRVFCSSTTFTETKERSCMPNAHACTTVLATVDSTHRLAACQILEQLPESFGFSLPGAEYSAWQSTQGWYLPVTKRPAHTQHTVPCAMLCKCLLSQWGQLAHSSPPKPDTSSERVNLQHTWSPTIYFSLKTSKLAESLNLTWSPREVKPPIATSLRAAPIPGSKTSSTV